MARLSSLKPEIKEYHFHVYWFQKDPESRRQASRLREKIVEEVKNGLLVAVCHGVTAEMLPGLNVSKIPPVNNEPKGPHPCGSFEVWVPFEWFDMAMSFFMMERGNLSILIHPLTASVMADHTKNALWLGVPFRLNLDIFNENSKDNPQYEELHLGYSAK